MNVRWAAVLLVFVVLCAGARGQGKGPGSAPPGAGPGAPGGGLGGPPGSGGHGPGGPGGPPPAGNGAGNGAPSGSGGTGTHNANQFGPVGRWWDDKSVVQTIGLRADQQRKMDTIFNANKPAILASYKTFLAQQAKLDAMSKQTKVDQAAMFAAIDAVSQARAQLQKANTQMLLQIRGEMEAGQIDKLEKLQ